MKSKERQVVIFADARPALVGLVHNRLAEAGIESFVENEFLGQAGGDLPAGAIMPRVVVAEADAEDAQEIVAEFQREAFGALAIISRDEEDSKNDVDADEEAQSSAVSRVIVLCPE